MKKNDDNNLPGLTNAEAFEMMDLIFKAGWEFGKSCIVPTSADALRLFKDTIKKPELADLLDGVIKAGSHQILVDPVQPMGTQAGA